MCLGTTRRLHKPVSYLTASDLNQLVRSIFLNVCCARTSYSIMQGQSYRSVPSNDARSVVILCAGAGTSTPTEMSTCPHLDLTFIQASPQAASHLLQTLCVLVLGLSSFSDGRIRDVKLAEGLEMTGLGVWTVDDSGKTTLELLG